MTIRLLIAEDHSVVRQGLRMVLDLDDELEVVGEASNGAEALALARALMPDTPFIFLSGTLTPGSGSDEPLSQANACLDKSDLDRLGALVKSLLPRAGSQS